jgi:hypothetical protein
MARTTMVGTLSAGTTIGRASSPHVATMAGIDIRHATFPPSAGTR